MIERAIDFDRLLYMRCGYCRHEWSVDANWLDRFDQGKESCPECGTDCQTEDRPDFWAPGGDPACDDSLVRNLYWYHTSAQPNWPNRTLDPAARLTEDSKLRMKEIGTDGRSLDRWTTRQKAKALHVGTYEAAIENMLRRIRNQDGSSEQFYLYRVRLGADATVEPGLRREPTDFVGDTHFAELGVQDFNTLRYVNTHEAPSSVSLAIMIDAIDSVQGISVPLSSIALDP